MAAGQGRFNRFFDVEESAVDGTTAFHSEKVQHLYDWWRGAANGGLPSRRVFDVVDHRPIVANLLLVEAREGGAFAFRLLGEEAIEIVGWNATGEIVGRGGRTDPGQALDDYYRRVAETRACRRCVGSLAVADMGPRRFESLDCPLSEGGETVDMIIGVIALVR